MCTNLSTEQSQRFIPSFLKNGFGAGDIRTQPNFDEGSVRPIKTGADIPLEFGSDADTTSILLRREKLKKAEAERLRQEQTNSGSIQPKGVRTRKQIMDELT
jgi:hypothetical protein